MKMRKLLLAFVFIASTAIANAQTFKKGDLDINAGLGLGYSYGFYSGSSAWPTLYASVEKGFFQIKDIGVISIGGLLAYEHISVSDLDYSWNDFYIGARAAFHFSQIKVENLDLYAGISTGLRFYSYPVYNYVITSTYPYYDYTYENETHTTTFGGMFAGAKYFFTNNFGAFGELGYDVTYLKLGVTFKL